MAIAFETTAFYNPAFQTSATVPLGFGTTFDVFLQIVPATNQVYVQRETARISVDGTFLKFSDFEFAQDAGRVGATLTVTCSDLDQRSLITNAGAYKYERFINGAWETRLDTGRLQSRDFSIGWGSVGPDDSFTFTVYDNRFEKAPTEAIVLYDGERLTLDDNDFEVKKDTEGNTYSITLENSTGLSVSGLFRRVFIDELGFASFQMNLPDFQIRRVDFPLSRKWLEPVSEKIGMFEALIYAVGTEVRIQDATQVFTTGLPAPLPLTVNRYERLQASAEETYIDGYEVDYIANENEFDDSIVRIVTPPDEITGTFGQDDYTRTAIQIYYLDFYKDGRVVREQYEATFKQIYGKNPFTGVSMQIGGFEEQISYDSQGNQTGSLVIEREIVPTYVAPSWFYSLDEVSRKSNGYSYAGHPYKPDARIMKRQTSLQRGKVVVDTDNPVFDNKPFKLGYRDALRGGHITETTTLEDAPIYSSDEHFTVETPDRVRVRGKKRDLLKGVTPIEYDEPRTGDISIDGAATQSTPVIVLPYDGYTLTGKPIPSKSINELPLEYGIPLTRRELDRLKNKPYSFTCEIWGFVAGMRQGITQALYYREDEFLGNMLVEGFRERGSNMGERGREIKTIITGRQI